MTGMAMGRKLSQGALISENKNPIKTSRFWFKSVTELGVKGKWLKNNKGPWPQESFSDGMGGDTLRGLCTHQRYISAWWVIKLKLKAIQVYVFVQNSEMRIKQQKWHLQMNWWNNILNTIVADLAHCEGTTDQPWPFTDVGTKINWKSWGQSDSATWIETSVGLGSPWGPRPLWD